MSPGYTLATIIVAALRTLFTRAVPFLFFAGRDIPPAVTYLGRVLPPAVIALLVVYCLKSVDFLSGWHGAAELISIATVAVLHLWKRNNLLSIGAGTLLYMLLVQNVFRS